MPDHEQNGWGEWRRHVLLEMEALRKNSESTARDLTDIKTEIALLKYKSSLFGAAGSALVLVIYALVAYLKK